ncbi:MAG: metallophosphoesterase [Promethearchaeota archaeon]
MTPVNDFFWAMHQAEVSSPEWTEDLLVRVTKVLSHEPRLIHLPEGPLVFVGDTHGDWEATKSLLAQYWDSPTTLVFLGDYVDRGPHQIENINLLFELKCQAPERIILLRGNHEVKSVNQRYGFYSEVTDKLGDFTEAYAASFQELPLAAVSSHRGVFAVHGGIAEGLERLEEIEELPREVELEHPITFQLLWNDPKENIQGFRPNFRGGGSRVFGRDVTERFFEENDLTLLVRAHEVFEQGYREFFDGLVISLFSCRHYGRPIQGKVLLIGSDGDRQYFSV